MQYFEDYTDKEIIWFVKYVREKTLVHDYLRHKIMIWRIKLRVAPTRMRKKIDELNEWANRLEKIILNGHKSNKGRQHGYNKAKLH